MVLVCGLFLLGVGKQTTNAETDIAILLYADASYAFTMVSVWDPPQGLEIPNEPVVVDSGDVLYVGWYFESVTIIETSDQPGAGVLRSA